MTLSALALLWLFVCASPAAAAPVHPFFEDLSLDGSTKTIEPKEFNKACGTAVDSEGDVYVASAGLSASPGSPSIDVFDSEHNFLITIENDNEPCGLAVDSKGNLYVSQAKTGKVEVIKYAPSTYPFVGTPVYGAPTTIDASGEARSIAVDPFDDRLFVAKGTAIDVYTSAGALDATVGAGDLSDATGVAAYTYEGVGNARYVFAADKSGAVIKVFGGTSLGSMSLRRTIDGSNEDALKDDATPDNGIGFGAAGAQLGVNRTNGHIFIYDAEHQVVDEFEATGAYVTQISSASFDDAEPSAVAVYPELNEVQRVQLDASGGTFKLSLEGEETAPLPNIPSGDEVRNALETLSTIGAGNVLVERIGATLIVTFRGALGNENVEQLDCDPSGLTGGLSTCEVTTKRGGSGPEGRVYVTSGAAAGAKLLAFGPLVAPSRPPRDGLSFKLSNVCSVAIDSHGNRYVGADTKIHVYDPAGKEIKVGPGGNGIEDPEGKVCDLAVDSSGKVYALDGNIGVVNGGRAVYFTPESFPPGEGTQYTGPTIVATPSDFGSSQPLRALGVNPANDHLFVANPSKIIEFDSAENGSPIVDSAFAGSLGIVTRADLDVCGANSNVYMVDSFSGAVVVADSSGDEVLARIDGAGSLKGPFGGGRPARVTVDQSNCHALTFSEARGEARGVVEEYEPSGAFVTEFGSFVSVPGSSGLAVDRSGGPQDGSVFVAYSGALTAFGPLAYGKPPPIALTGLASAAGGGNATLNGTVDPRGFDLDDCRFEYVTDAEYRENVEEAEAEGHEEAEAEGYGFEGAEEEECAESLAEIGKDTKAVAVHATLSGLDPDGRYRFRLIAENEYGVCEKCNEEAGVFGPPVILTETAQPVSYTEVIARATIDPSGLASEYQVEYGTSEVYGQSTAKAQLAPGAGATQVQIPIFGLSEGTLYHFRVVAENEVKPVPGPDQTFETLVRAREQKCPNTEFRTGFSAGLPDCRAYELVTPADTRGLTPYATQFASYPFSNWLTVPRGAEAGERISYFTDGTLPGFDGTGRRDGYRSQRTATGWQTELVGPSYLQAGGSQPGQNGVSSDQEHSLWSIDPSQSLEGTLPAGEYLRQPKGFEPLGQGSLDTDLEAESRYLSGPRAIFSSTTRLEPEAPPPGTEALYERTAGSPTAQVVSLKPDGSSFAGGEPATYIGSTEDGSAVAFEVSGTLYLRRSSAETIPIVAGPNTFAGISEDREHVFYVDAAVSGPTPAPADLYVFDVDTQNATKIAPESRFVNVSADGSHVYFTSKAVLDDEGEGKAGEHNLYLWEGGSEEIRFLTVLDPQDVAEAGFEGFNDNLVRWLTAVDSGTGSGRAYSPTRSTPSGDVLVFASHGSLISYDSEEHPEIYRYDADAQGGQGELRCVSCDPSGAPPSGDATLQSLRADGITEVTTVIPNVTEDGATVFFESQDPLLPEDANGVQDIYEWKANGAGDCKRTAGCLALISSGQGEHDNFLYSMTSAGHDVFFVTLEKLVGADLPGSPSIYDARIDGGIPDPPAKAPCQGDACQGQGSVPPSLPVPASAAGSGPDRVQKPRPRCPKSKRKVRRGDKVRCVKRQAKKHSKHLRANADRGVRR